MSNATDAGAEGTGDCDHTAGLSPQDQEQLKFMTLRLQQNPDKAEVGTFATVGAAALAADTLRGLGYKVNHSLLAVRASS